MKNDTLFSAHPVTWAKVHECYGPQAIVTGVKAWYHPVHGWKDFPATSCMAMLPEQQVISLAEQGAIALQLYIDVGPEDTCNADFRITELYTPPPCSTSSTSTKKSEAKDTPPSTTSASSTATKPPSRRASRSTEPATAPASPPPATSAESPTT
ncbi:MAG TPA: hypothetical protein PK228_01485 [Saprospiraceae bacterium]|nr:hypothetical protein [Saprospiraceae bacterium]